MRLLSYNIHKGIGGVDRRYKLDRICRVIAAENPDLVCLQEVTSNSRRTKYDDQPGILLQYLKAFDSCYQMNVHHKVGGYGNLLLSRWPIQTQHHVCLRLKKRKPRGAQLVVIDTPAGQLHLTNWHLGLAERERHWQAEQLLDHPTFRSLAHLPTLMVGDFNDWRNTLAKGPFAKHDFEQATGPMRHFRSFPAFMPLLTLDKAFHRGGIDIHDVRLVRSRLAYWASDHLPLLIDFQPLGAQRENSSLFSPLSPR